MSDESRWGFVYVETDECRLVIQYETSHVNLFRMR
jgi:hypothetical protein